MSGTLTPPAAGAAETRPALATAVLLSDLDAMIREAQEPVSRARLRKLGFGLDGLPRLVALRSRLADTLERRWTLVYERARQRYGRGLAAVRERVCSGCFVTLPSIARPRLAADALHVCESCGRLLYWA